MVRKIFEIGVNCETLWVLQLQRTEMTVDIGVVKVIVTIDLIV